MFSPYTCRAQRSPLGNNRMASYCDPGRVSPDSVLATAEDGLLLNLRVNTGKQQYNGDAYS